MQRSRAASRSILARPYICRFTSLSLVICPSVWPLDHGLAIAAMTAALSLRIPAAKEAMRLVEAATIHPSRSGLFRRTMAWNPVQKGPSLDKCRHAAFDGRQGHCVGLAEMVASGGHERRNNPGGGNPLELLFRHGLGSPASGPPFADYAKGTAEPLRLQPSP